MVSSIGPWRRAASRSFSRASLNGTGWNCGRGPITQRHECAVVVIPIQPKRLIIQRGHSEQFQLILAIVCVRPAQHLVQRLLKRLQMPRSRGYLLHARFVRFTDVRKMRAAFLRRARTHASSRAAAWVVRSTTYPGRASKRVGPCQFFFSVPFCTLTFFRSYARSRIQSACPAFSSDKR